MHKPMSLSLFYLQYGLSKNYVDQNIGIFDNLHNYLL